MKNKLITLFVFSSFLFFVACTKEDDPEADLSVTQTSSSDSPVIGSNVNFTVTVSNNGPDNATGVTVTANVPSGYTLVSATPSGGSITGTSWLVGTLGNGASATLNLVATVKNAGSYDYTVSVMGSQTDPIASNNSTTKTIVPVEPVLKVTYTADVKPILIVSCAPCHVAGGYNSSKFDQYAVAKSKINGIIDRVNRDKGASGFMPSGGNKLSADKLAILSKWVADGLLEN